MRGETEAHRGEATPKSYRECYRKLYVKPRRLQTLAVRTLGGLRNWRLRHEARLRYECLSCGEDCFLGKERNF